MMVGNGVSRLIERALPENTAPSPRSSACASASRSITTAITADHTKPYPGIPELLAGLQSRGVAIAVASNKYQEAVTRLMEVYFPTSILWQPRATAPECRPSLILDSV